MQAKNDHMADIKRLEEFNRLRINQQRVGNKEIITERTTSIKENNKAQSTLIKEQ